MADDLDVGPYGKALWELTLAAGHKQESERDVPAIEKQVALQRETNALLRALLELAVGGYLEGR